MRRHRASRGFTLLELTISSSILTTLLFVGVTVSRGSILATRSIATRELVDGAATRSLTRIEQLLLPASVSSLQGIPAGGVAVEVMQSNVSYTDLRFRAVVGYANGAAVTDPPAGVAPRRLWFAADARGVGTLWFDDGDGAVPLLVRALHDGAALTSEQELSVRLLTP